LQPTALLPSPPSDLNLPRDARTILVSVFDMISRHMHRRAFFHACLGAASAIPLAGRADAAGLPKTKITRIRYYKTPTDAAGRPNNKQPLFNQSTHVVLIETDSGLVGLGEVGAWDT